MTTPPAPSSRREIPLDAITQWRLHVWAPLRTRLAHLIGTESRLDATFSDLVAFGEISHSGRIPTHGAAAAELARLLDELVVLGWVGCHARAY